MEEELKQIKELAQNNARAIENNAKRIDDNFGKINNNSYALEILKDYKNGEERLYKIVRAIIKVLVFTILLWVFTIGYLVYVLNDTSTETKEIDIDNVDIIDKSNIENR